MNTETRLDMPFSEDGHAEGDPPSQADIEFARSFDHLHSQLVRVADPRMDACFDLELAVGAFQALQKFGNTITERDRDKLLWPLQSALFAAEAAGVRRHVPHLREGMEAIAHLIVRMADVVPSTMELVDENDLDTWVRVLRNEIQTARFLAQLQEDQQRRCSAELHALPRCRSQHDHVYVSRSPIADFERPRHPPRNRHVNRSPTAKSIEGRPRKLSRR